MKDKEEIELIRQKIMCLQNAKTATEMEEYANYFVLILKYNADLLTTIMQQDKELLALEETKVTLLKENTELKERLEKAVRLDNKKEITEEQVEALYCFLQGELPQGWVMKRNPKFSQQMAFRIIYYLQEEMGVIPDIYERCVTCGCIFNSENEGDLEKMHCDVCRR